MKKASANAKDNASTISPLKGKKDLESLLDILAPTFNFSRELGERYSALVGEKNYRVIRHDGVIAGGCALLPFGQFFGGKSVPMMGVAAVGIAPEHRGRRTATTLMQAALREMHANGYPISALYPATLPLYRSVGYEHAGTRFEIRIPAKTMVFKQRCNELQMRRITPKDDRVLRELYTSHAQHCPGHLDRSDFIWHRIRQPRGQTTMGFILINPATGKPEGYTYYLQKEATEAAYSLHVTDLLATTPAAARQLWCFFADHRSMTHEIIFQGGPDDPLIKMLPERNYPIKLLDHWMVRIVDVAAALAVRGYAPGISVEVHLDVEDDLLVDNNGRYVLDIRNGKAGVSSGGRGDIKIDIRGLAALYTGYASPHDLIIAGQLSLSPQIKAKDSSRVLAEAAAAFAGKTPWMREMF